jgi:transcriptional regulator with XRE-family HTH domain
MNQLLERLRRMFTDEDARYAYADSTVNAFIAAQIKALREDRELSQEQLADLIGTKQSGISRLEKADYSSWKIETLRKLAKAFGVRLKVGFEEFGSILPDISGFTKDRLTPRKFEDDPVFNQASVSAQSSDKDLLDLISKAFANPHGSNAEWESLISVYLRMKDDSFPKTAGSLQRLAASSVNPEPPKEIADVVRISDRLYRKLPGTETQVDEECYDARKQRA